MATQKVNIQVSTTGAKKSQSELSSLTGSINKVGKAVGIASAAYFGAKGLISALSGVIQLTARQEKAEKALEVALGKTSISLLKQASALQRVSTVGDEAIIEQQAFLASLKFTEDQIKTIIPVALDLSAATGISLESAVRNTAKTFSGLAGELGELVPQLRDLTAEEMKAGEAVKVLGELFEGQASEQTDTLSGSLEQMSNAVGDAGEAIGKILSPAIIAVSKVLQLTAETVSKIASAISDDLPRAVLEASDAFAEQAKQMQGTSEHTATAKEFLKLLTDQYEEGTRGAKAYSVILKSIAKSHEDGEKVIKLLTIAEKQGAITRAESLGGYTDRKSVV